MRVFLLTISMLAPVAAQADKVALILGNSAYQNVTPLTNPSNDADAISEALGAQGFNVTVAKDLTRNELYDVLRSFRAKADQSSVAMIYYAGHGIEISGQNFLIPIDAYLVDERDADTETVNMDLLLRQISGAKKLKMIVLDACRDNPFVERMKREGRTRNINRGLAIVTNSEAATLIAYAAAAGEVTPDGIEGGNSPFTKAFLRALERPPADVRVIMGAVRDEMSKTVPGAVPFVYSSLGAEEIVINPNSKGVVPVAAPLPEAPNLDENQMLREYALAEFSRNIDDWSAFLKKYSHFPDHTLYVLATRSLQELQSSAPAGYLPSAPEALARNTATSNHQVPQADQLLTSLSNAAPERPLDEVKRELQSLLKEKNCYLGEIDGLWGSGSKEALRKFKSFSSTSIELTENSQVASFEAAISLVRMEKAVCPISRITATSAISLAAPNTAIQAQRTEEEQVKEAERNGCRTRLYTNGNYGSTTPREECLAP